jgi:hypothetical protein
MKFKATFPLLVFFTNKQAELGEQKKNSKCTIESDTGGVKKIDVHVGEEHQHGRASEEEVAH